MLARLADAAVVAIHSFARQRHPALPASPTSEPASEPHLSLHLGLHLSLHTGQSPLHHLPIAPIQPLPIQTHRCPTTAHRPFGLWRWHNHLRWRRDPRRRLRRHRLCHRLRRHSRMPHSRAPHTTRIPTSRGPTTFLLLLLRRWGLQRTQRRLVCSSGVAERVAAHRAEHSFPIIILHLHAGCHCLHPTQTTMHKLHYPNLLSR
mmetsp:Transcript_29289/g.62939  ORF Transcript_29289/g.62939 Transcript_29289/m.62939 type:complete len:204 (+) Transcript_29289:70-681(+)